MEKHITAVTAQPESILKEQVTAFRQGYLDLAGDLNVCSKRGLAERFDATIGSGTVLMPFGLSLIHISPMELLARRTVYELEGEEGDKHLEEYSDPNTDRGKKLRETICEKLHFTLSLIHI